MKATRVARQQVADAFNQNVADLETKVRAFLESSDPSNAQAMRKATKRLKTSYSVLPKKLRRETPIRRYLSASRRLAKATGKVRDLDTVAAWTMQVTERKDRRSFALDLGKLRAPNVRGAVHEAKELRKTKAPSVVPEGLVPSKVEKRVTKVETRLSRRVDEEFEEFLSTQEVEVMHSLRKDAKRLRLLMELTGQGDESPLLQRLKSIQDDLGAIRDHDLVIDYLRKRGRLTNTRLLVREEIAKRHARLEDFLTKNRGQGHLVPSSAKGRG
jgi:CHAD domain-containing protein